MGDFFVQVSIPYQTGLPADITTNTWHFHSTAADPTPTELGAFLSTFYTAFIDVAGDNMDFTQVGIKGYDQADPEPRSPSFTGLVDLGTGNLDNGPALPEEVATCLSFRGNLESGQPAARRRGRVFLGPLSSSVLGETTRTLINSSVLTDLLDAYEAAWTELTTAGVSHSVWSPTDGVGRPVVSAWMDNAFDTQRRRGTLADYRDTRNGPF